MPEERERVTVIGAGYVGLVTAVGLAQSGRDVELIERDRERLAALRRGQVPIFEQGLQEAFSSAVTAGRLVVRDAIAAAPGIVMICVGTPISDDGRSDLSQLRAALTELRQVSDD